MRYFIFFLYVFFVQITLFAQNTKQVPDSTLKIIAKDACECFNQRNTDGTINQNAPIPTEEQIQICFGLVILKYTNQLPADVFGTNQNVGEELGKQLAPFLMKDCPKFVDFVLASQQKNDKEAEKFVFFEGIFQKLETRDYILVTIKTDSGKIEKFLWLKSFKGDNLFMEKPKNMRGKKIRIKTKKENEEFYHHKSKKYVEYKEIVMIEEVK